MANEIRTIKCDNCEEIKSFMPKLLEELKNTTVMSIEIKKELLNVTPDGGRWTEYKTGKITYSITTLKNHD